MSLEIIVDDATIPVAKFHALYGSNVNGKQQPDKPKYFAIGFQNELYVQLPNNTYKRQGSLDVSRKSTPQDAYKR